MGIGSILTSESGLTLVSGLLGAVWTLFKSSEWFARRRERRVASALQVLEAAVEATFREYVAALKAGRADGKLMPDEQARARSIARERALAIARKEGVDLLGVVGEEYLNLWIAKLVRGLKPG